MEWLQKYVSNIYFFIRTRLQYEASSIAENLFFTFWQTTIWETSILILPSVTNLWRYHWNKPVDRNNAHLMRTRWKQLPSQIKVETTPFRTTSANLWIGNDDIWEVPFFMSCNTKIVNTGETTLWCNITCVCRANMVNKSCSNKPIYSWKCNIKTLPINM